MEKDYNEFKMLNVKQSVEVVLIQRAVETNTQMLYDKGLFDAFPKTDKVLKQFMFVTRRRFDFREVNDDVIQPFY